MKKNINLSDIHHYFDSVEQDLYDKSPSCRRASLWLSLREKLLKLPEERYESTLLALDGILRSALASDEERGKDSPEERRKAGLTLYEKAAPSKRSRRSTQNPQRPDE